MLCALLLLFAAFSALLGLLTVISVPRWLDWRVGLLAGEYGHWVALGALAVAGGAAALREGRPLCADATVALGLVGAGLLLKPAFQAWRIGRDLPARFERAFVAARSERLEARLAAVGVPHLFVSLPWATHAFEHNLNGPAASWPPPRPRPSWTQLSAERAAFTAAPRRR